ncbi:protein KNATM [Ricinus communis]|uniref:protein KNATM n=1 Tax=Ricinus communis TaxID=3988 RepID=UPI00201ADDA7|nr:protein KNATM [Ricinus communis]
MEAEGEIVMEVKSTENEKHCKNGSSRAAKEEEEEEEKEIQKRILGHPLYSLLVETHIDCLKVGLGEIANVDPKQQANVEPQSPKKGSSDLSLFMDCMAFGSKLFIFLGKQEAYCVALNKLKEAMEESLQETAKFIKAMHNQLAEINDKDQ